MNIDIKNMDVCRIALLIADNWKKVNFAAKPYLGAMLSLHSVNDRHGYDDGKTVILYFLANAGTWRGDMAREIKAELKRRIA
jgi:hypothetical protein